MDRDLLRRTVIALPDPEETAPVSGGSMYNTITLNLVTTASKITPWGVDWVKRDRELRAFWPKEPYLASAIYSIAATRSAFTWHLSGPPKTVSAVHEMLSHSDLGNGWLSLMFKVAIDVLTQDNGGFVEIVRQKPRRGRTSENAPVLGLAHLDSGRCVRTGNPEVPVLYTSEDDRVHELKWWQVITFEEMPMPVDTERGRQFCFLSRVLKASEIVYEINKYESEKVSGQFSRAIHLVSGIAAHEIADAKRTGLLNAQNSGLSRYMEPIILASLDPNAKVQHELIELATLPDSFDQDTTMKWYITLLALASGGDFQDFAPLPGGNLGTASQSETLSRKSRIKGNALWMKLWEQKVHSAKVVPSTVTFQFSHQDAIAEAETAQLRQMRATTRSTQIASGELTVEVARQVAVEDGDLKQAHLIQMGSPLGQEPSVIVYDDDNPDAILAADNAASEIPVPTAPPTAPPPPQEEAKVSFTSAAKAARWLRFVIETSKVQTVVPIQTSKLNVFEQSLRNTLYGSKIKAVGTDAYWLDNILIDASLNAGIEPYALRMRLPDQYQLFFAKDGVYDINGRIINKDVKKVVKTKEVKELLVKQEPFCHYCNEKPTASGFTIGAAAGWVSVCDKHRTSTHWLEAKGPRGWSIKELGTTLAEALTTAKNTTSTSEQYDVAATALVGAALRYSYALGANKVLPISEIGGIIEDLRRVRKVASLMPETSYEALLLTYYYKGVLASR